MLAGFAPPIRGLILDMDGVLWSDASPIGDLRTVFRVLAERQLSVVLATNNATRTVEEYLEKLRSFRVSLESRQIVTSSIATARVLAERFPAGGRVFVIGEGGLLAALRQAGFSPITDPAQDSAVLAVVAGIDRAVSYDKLRRATLHIRAGAPFYGTNPDKTFPTPLGLVPGAGSILAALEAATDVTPIVVGKPSPLMMEIALERLGLQSDEVLVVGDRLETDMAAGHAAGMRTALVLSGVSTLEQAERWNPRPDLIASSLSAVLEA
jgi:4-nitrophenyl phosphatase